MAVAAVFAVLLPIVQLAAVAVAAPVDPPRETIVAPRQVMTDVPSSGPAGPPALSREPSVPSEVLEPPQADEPPGATADPVGTPGAAPLPPIEYDPSKLPTPVRRLREQIMEAAATGDPEMLRPIIDANGEPPDFSFNAVDDPIAYLRSLSGDPEGREILAILIEVLEAGYVHVNAGQADEIYIWPYFARYPIEQLTGPQLVELFKIVLAGDYEDMKVFGTYFAYRVGIDPQGRWRYFLVGD